VQEKLNGDPVTVVDSVVDGNIAAFSATSSGTLAYRAGGRSRRQLTWFDRSGKALGTMAAPDENNLTDPSLSRDGRRVAVRRTIQTNTDIWILDGIHANRLTADPAFDAYPIWSPDGNRIVFASDRKGKFDLYAVKPLSIVGSESLLWE